MTNKFNVGDRVKFTSEWRKYLNRYGCIKAVSTGRYYIDGCIKDGYFVEWDGGEHSWISENKLSLVTPESTTVQETKELKAEIESEIIRLIQDFNKRPTLKFKTLIFDYYRTIGGGCFYQVNVKVRYTLILHQHNKGTYVQI